jgi:hypothetical protein
MLVTISIPCTKAFAARYVPVKVYLNNRLILKGNISDNGLPDADAVWENLKTAELHETEAFKNIQLDKIDKTFRIGSNGIGENPIRLDVRYGGLTETANLAIHQQSVGVDGPIWRISAAEIDRLFDRRMVSRTDVDRIAPNRKQLPKWLYVFCAGAILATFGLGFAIGRKTKRLPGASIA